MICQKCGKKVISRWVRISPSRQRLIVTCGCQTESGKKSFSFHRFKDATAFGRDKKTGKPIALDKKGKRIAIEDTRYDLRKDPHGWRTVGLKVRSKDKFGRPM